MASGGTAGKNHMRPKKHFLPITSIQKYFQPEANTVRGNLSAGHHVGDPNSPPDPSECSSLVQRACLLNTHNREIIMNHVLSPRHHFTGVYFHLDCNREISFLGFVGRFNCSTSGGHRKNSPCCHISTLRLLSSKLANRRTDRQPDGTRAILPAAKHVVRELCSRAAHRRDSPPLLPS